MTKPDFFAQVDDYVRGKLDDQALVAFEDAMVESPDLFAEVELAEAMVKGLRETKPVLKRRRFIPMASAAAIFLVGLISYPLFFSADPGSIVIRPILGEAVSEHVVEFGQGSTFILLIETTLEPGEGSWEIKNLAEEEILNGHWRENPTFEIQLKKRDFPRGIYTLVVLNERGSIHIKARLKVD